MGMMTIMVMVTPTMTKSWKVSLCLEEDLHQMKEAPVGQSSDCQGQFADLSVFGSIMMGCAMG